jgi:hypothetical protein
MLKHRGSILEHQTSTLAIPERLLDGEPGIQSTPRESERSQEPAGSNVPRAPKMDERTRRAPGGKKCVTYFLD